MCDCGCEDDVVPTYPNYTMDDIQLQRNRSNQTNPGTSFHDARRALTFNDTTNIHNDYYDRSQYYPDGLHSFQEENGSNSVCYIKELLDITGTQGIAVVQRDTANKNTSLDYGGGVQRQHSTSRDSSSGKFRAALPYYGSTPCSPSNINRTQNRGCLRNRR